MPALQYHKAEPLVHSLPVTRLRPLISHDVVMHRNSTGKQFPFHLLK